MASAPPDLKYLQTHEWHRIEGDTATIGITQFAADELTDITFVSLPKVGTALSANGRFGEVESVKATSDLYTGVGGTVTAINEALSGDPSLVNEQATRYRPRSNLGAVEGTLKQDGQGHRRLKRGGDCDGKLVGR